MADTKAVTPSSVVAPSAVDSAEVPILRAMPVGSPAEVSGFPVTPPAPSGVEAPRRCIVRADYYAGQINLRKFRERNPHYPVLASDPLIIEPERGSYVVLSKFGGVAYWNCSEAVVQDISQELASLPETGGRQEKIQDYLEVYVGAAEDTATFNEVRLRDLPVEKIRMVSRALNQSVALDHFEREVLEALRRFDPVIRNLREGGRLVTSEKAVVRHIGFALEVRAAVLANLTLFDDPPETWESQDLARLHALLYDHFDLEERLSAINQKVDFLTDLNDTLMDVLNNRKSHRLEWIIIILIFVEIVFFVYVDAVARLH